MYVSKKSTDQIGMTRNSEGYSHFEKDVAVEVCRVEVGRPPETSTTI